MFLAVFLSYHATSPAYYASFLLHLPLYFFPFRLLFYLISYYPICLAGKLALLTVILLVSQLHSFFLSTFSVFQFSSFLAVAFCSVLAMLLTLFNAILVCYSGSFLSLLPLWLICLLCFLLFFWAICHLSYLLPFLPATLATLFLSINVGILTSLILPNLPDWFTCTAPCHFVRLSLAFFLLSTFSDCHSSPS